jgi:hypothetical protein
VTKGTIYDNYFKLQRCNQSNLLCFQSRQHIHRYRVATLGDSLPSLVKIWRCHTCTHYHYWAAGNRKSAGMVYCAGALRLPFHVQLLSMPLEWVAQRAIAQEEMEQDANL